MLRRNIEIIRSIKDDSLPNMLSGPEVSVSAVNVYSIKILLWSLKKLKENRESFSYKKVNLLRYMTLSVENLHPAVNRKEGTQILVYYAQGFATTIEKSKKAVNK